MKLTDAFPSQYMSAADLRGQPAVVTISHVVVEEVGQGDNKPVAYFQGGGKSLILNKTNFGNIAHMYGDESDNWPGRQIELYEIMTEYQGKSVMGLRVRQPATVPVAPPQQYAQPAPAPMAPTPVAPPPVQQAQPVAPPVGPDPNALYRQQQPGPVVESENPAPTNAQLDAGIHDA